MARAGKLAKLADRNVGIPLIFTLGLLRGRRSLPARIERIGLFKEACIGDTVLLAGLVADLRRKFPSARILFFAGPTNRAMAALLPVDEVIAVPVTNPLRSIRVFRAHPVDVLLDFGQWPRINALYSWCSASRFTVGFRTPGQARHRGYDKIVAHRADRHEIENFQALLEPLDAGGNSLPAIEPQASSPEGESGDFVVCHPWPGGLRSELREWPADRWIELIRRFQDRGLRVLVTGGPEDKTRSESLVTNVGSPLVRSIAGTGNLGSVAAVLRQAKCVVSVNTGIMHLAAAVGAPTVGLNGPTSELRWGPVGRRVDSASVPPPHGGYLNLGFEYAGHPVDCMERIDVDQVWQKALSMLERP